MKQHIVARATELGNYICNTNATVRQTAKQYNISKSTVHKDVSARLKRIDSALHKQVKDILQVNLNERHIRGGIATKTKYLKQH